MLTGTRNADKIMAMENEKKKTADYTRRAIKKYEEKFDRIGVLLPAGTKKELEKIAAGRSIGAVCRDIIMEYLKTLPHEDGEDAENLAPQGI